MLRIKKDIENDESRLQMQLKSLVDNSTMTTTTTMANDTKVISARVKKKMKQQRVMKRLCVIKIVRTHHIANKRKPSIRKIHIRLEKNIYIITNSCQQCAKRNFSFDNEKLFQNSINKSFQFERRKLKNIFFIFGIRVLKELIFI